MRSPTAGIIELLVRDGLPEPVPGPDGELRPPVPLGRRVGLPGRGTTFVREVAGPPHVPTLVLLHGWSASGGLNWFRAFEALRGEFRVLAPDLRGHGRGLRSRKAFRLSDCADDVATLLGELRTGPVVVAGYSMGGPVALHLWRRHPELVSGLVLCATAPRFTFGVAGARPVNVALGAVATGARVGGRLAHVPSTPLRAVASRRVSRAHGFVEWTIGELRRHDTRHLLEAARDASAFDGRAWVADIDIPTAVMVTTRDRVVTPSQQLEAAALIDGASVHEIAGGHAVCARERFVAPFRDACRAVATRASGRVSASAARASVQARSGGSSVSAHTSATTT
jgi:pimeloyl-ACP methyl ester carboxylesterase